MSKHRAARRNLQRGDVAGFAGATLATAAVIGIGVTHIDRSTLAHPVTAFVRLLSGPSDTGVDAFTLGPYTFDPYTTPLASLSSPKRAGPHSPPRSSPVRRCLISPAGIWTALASPLKTSRCSTPAARKSGPSTPPGPYCRSWARTATSSPSPAQLRCWEDTAADLPAVGTVYDIYTGLFAGTSGEFEYHNVYEATPSGTVSDYVVLPSGQYSLASPIPVPQDFLTLDLSGLLTQNFAEDLEPGDAFSNLATSADSSIGSNAFTINVPGFDYTLDPVSTLLAPDTYNAVTPLAGFPPLFAAGGADFVGISVDTQDFDVYNTGGTEVGSVDADEFVVNFLGLTARRKWSPAHSRNSGLPTRTCRQWERCSASPTWPRGYTGAKDEIYLATPTTSATDTTVTTAWQLHHCCPLQPRRGRQRGDQPGQHLRVSGCGAGAPGRQHSASPPRRHRYRRFHHQPNHVLPRNLFTHRGLQQHGSNIGRSAADRRLRRLG